MRLRYRLRPAKKGRRRQVHSTDWQLYSCAMQSHNCTAYFGPKPDFDRCTYGSVSLTFDLSASKQCDACRAKINNLCADRFGGPSLICTVSYRVTWTHTHTHTLHTHNTQTASGNKDLVSKSSNVCQLSAVAYQGSEGPWFKSNLGPSLSLHFTSPSLPFPPLSLLFPNQPILLPRSGPQIQLGGLGSAVSSLSGVWGGAPTEIEFGAF